jgi:hypothetical protein
MQIFCLDGSLWEFRLFPIYGLGDPHFYSYRGRQNVHEEGSTGYFMTSKDILSGSHRVTTGCKVGKG